MPRMPFKLAASAATLLLCSSVPAAPAAVQELVGLLPADTIGIAVVRVDELQASSSYRELEQRFAFGHGLGLDEFIGLTGVDPGHDIDGFVIAVRSIGTERFRRSAVSLVRGHFDEQRIRSALDESSTRLSSESPEGAILYSLPQSGDGVLAIISPEVIAFGDRGSVEFVLRQRTTQTDAALSPDSGLRRALDEASGAGQVWGSLSLNDVLPIRSANLELSPPAAALRALTWASFEITFGQDLSLKLTGVADSIEDATLVQQALDGMLAMGKLAAKENPRRLALLAGTVITRSLDHVTLELTLPGELILGE